MSVGRVSEVDFQARNLKDLEDEIWPEEQLCGPVTDIPVGL